MSTHYMRRKTDLIASLGQFGKNLAEYFDFNDYEIDEYPKGTGIVQYIPV
jgi:hypothetical protein